MAQQGYNSVCKDCELISLDSKMNTKGSRSVRDDGLYLAVLQPQNYKITFIYKQTAISYKNWIISAGANLVKDFHQSFRCPLNYYAAHARVYALGLKSQLFRIQNVLYFDTEYLDQRLSPSRKTCPFSMRLFSSR